MPTGPMTRLTANPTPGTYPSWAARKQQCVSLSSTEVEYVTLSEASQELVWIMMQMHDVSEDVVKPVMMNEDNKSCIAMLSSTGASRRKKHIDTRFNFVEKLISSDVMEVCYCSTESMIANFLTKPLARIKLDRFCSLIDLKLFDVEETIICYRRVK